MKILFITSSRIGDAVLSTGLLDYIAQSWPQAKVTIACGPLAASLFDGYPLLDDMMILKKQPYNGHWINLWRFAVQTRWDMVVDLRNSLVSRLIRADRRHVFGPHINSSRHKIEQNAAVMGLTQTPMPVLWFSEAQIRHARTLIPDGGPVLAIGPSANWRAKTWPAERFIEIISWLTAPGGRMPGARVAVFAAPGEEDVARLVLESVPADRRIDVIGKADPGTAAAALSLCQLYIGNDSGLMHCAAASGVPTMGLFGPSYPHIYGPKGAQAAFVATPQTFSELIDYPGYTPETAPCLMGGLSVESVQRAVTKLLDGR